jgi:hypothetical protein
MDALRAVIDQQFWWSMEPPIPLGFPVPSVLLGAWS